MLLSFTAFVFAVNIVVFFVSRFDLRGCATDNELDECLKRWYQIFWYVIVLNLIVNLICFYHFYVNK